MTTSTLEPGRAPADLLMALLLALLAAVAGAAAQVQRTTTPLLRTAVLRTGTLLRLPAPHVARPVPVLPRPTVRLVGAGPVAVLAAQRRMAPVIGGPGAPRARRRITPRDLVLPAVLLAEFGVGVLIGVLT